MSNLTCNDCINTADFAGNYKECVLLHSFVDWFYWNNSAPGSCPLNGVTDSDTRKTVEKEWRKERKVDE